ncbi:MAG: hypothetical protein V5A30_05960 [Haloarculaceae archaeon]
MDGYCEPADVRTALQETSLSGPTNESIVTDEIVGVSNWLRKQSGRHWYDSGGSTSDLVSTDAETAGTVRLDVPSSPHAQRDQIHRYDRGVRYPVTTDGPYARLSLPHGYVESIDALEVRDRSGDVAHWVASSDYQEGRGEDYYVQEEDREGHGRSYLYLRAASIGARRDYSGLVTADYTYGLDYQSEPWDDVQRGVALLTAAQVVVDDDVLAAIPDNGQLIGVDTQAQQLADRGERYLEPYL